MSARWIIILWLGACVTAALTIRWWGPLPDWWRGFGLGAILSWCVRDTIELRRKRKRMDEDNALTKRLNGSAERLENAAEKL
jgi:hypothetical protein